MQRLKGATAIINTSNSLSVDLKTPPLGVRVNNVKYCLFLQGDTHCFPPLNPPSTLHPSMSQCFRRHIPRSMRNVGSVWFKNSPISSSAWHAAPARLIVVRAAGMWRWLQIWESYWSRTCPPLEYRGQETGFSRANALFPTTHLWVLCQILHAWTLNNNWRPPDTWKAAYSA